MVFQIVITSMLVSVVTLYEILFAVTCPIPLVRLVLRCFVWNPVVFSFISLCWYCWSQRKCYSVICMYINWNIRLLISHQLLKCFIIACANFHAIKFSKVTNNTQCEHKSMLPILNRLSKGCTMFTLLPR